jgi:hypothetical protein
MGTIAEGTVTVGGQKVNCKADFASDHVTFSGGRRGEVPYSKIEVVGTARGILKLRVDGALMEFPLGTKVDRIAAKVRRPPALMDKLGVKPGLTVANVGVEAKAFKAELAKAAPEATRGEPGRPVDLLFLSVRGRDELDRIPDMVHHVKPEGGLWVVYPKVGRAGDGPRGGPEGRQGGAREHGADRAALRAAAGRALKPPPTEQEFQEFPGSLTAVLPENSCNSCLGVGVPSSRRLRGRRAA